MTVTRDMALVVLVALGACSPDRRFETRATYDAPKTGFRMIIDAWGIVPPGADLGAGPSTVLICPRAKSARELRIDLPPYGRGSRSGVAHDGATTSILPWEYKTAPASLTRALAGVGLTPDAAEVDEAVRVINGVGEGPKATTMPGQTHALTVASVDFEKPPGPPRCAP